MMTRIGIIGECMVELSDGPEGMLKKAFSGDTFNTAVYLSRCSRGRDLDIQYVTALGDDVLSREMLSLMKAENIGSDLIHCFEGEVPGLYMIHLDDAGERSFSYWRSQAPARKLFEQPEIDQLIQGLKRFDWLYLSGISLAILRGEGRAKLKAFLASYREGGGRVCFDINYRPRLWSDAAEAAREIEALYRLSDMALPSFDDEKLLFGSKTAEYVIDRLRGLGCREIVVKDGGNPCTLLADGELSRIPGESVTKVVDSTAAGDSFNAGYLQARLAGYPAVKAVRAGQVIARQVIGAKGAIVPVRLEEMTV